jgi:hypothetical protein
VEANSTEGQGSRSAIAPNDDDEWANRVGSIKYKMADTHTNEQTNPGQTGAAKSEGNYCSQGGLGTIKTGH